MGPGPGPAWRSGAGWGQLHRHEEPFPCPTHALGFGRVDGYQPPSWPDEGGGKQFHLDLAVADLDEAQTTATGLGATVVDPQPGETWRVLRDPSGHLFCLTRAENWG
ncbi:VOC family protein [Nocardioides sp. HDW12B]|nr:VOC family protein [Nocardioides sp. HDW12B]